MTQTVANNAGAYVQYGCGLSAPEKWLNFDASPTLRIQKIPVLGQILRKKLNVVFPDNVIYGDIVKGLPIEVDSCEGVYCSHVVGTPVTERFQDRIETHL
ncbi:MAG: hypothetical protein KDD54_02555 [Flavobacteriales bacterium]|nr:hypothetical protein [Flavobacteriales bacterium]